MGDLRRIRKLEPIPYYFKKDFPDQRFLPFRMLIRSKKAYEEMPNIGYFESRWGDCLMQKKKFRRNSKEKSERIFRNKEKLYCKVFTNGNVDIRNEYPILAKSSSRTPAYSRIDEKIQNCIKKNERNNKTPLGMWMEQDKKKGFDYNRIFRTKKIED